MANVDKFNRLKTLHETLNSITADDLSVAATIDDTSSYVLNIRTQVAIIDDIDAKRALAITIKNALTSVLGSKDALLQGALDLVGAELLAEAQEIKPDVDGEATAIDSVIALLAGE